MKCSNVCTSCEQMYHFLPQIDPGNEEISRSRQSQYILKLSRSNSEEIYSLNQYRRFYIKIYSPGATIFITLPLKITVFIYKIFVYIVKIIYRKFVYIFNISKIYYNFSAPKAPRKFWLYFLIIYKNFVYNFLDIYKFFVYNFSNIYKKFVYIENILGGLGVKNNSGP